MNNFDEYLKPCEVCGFAQGGPDKHFECAKVLQENYKDKFRRSAKKTKNHKEMDEFTRYIKDKCGE